MASPQPKRWWRISRMCLRGVRRIILVALLILVAALGWLNTIGLPDFLKRPLIAQLHARGLDLEFSRLRWRYIRGLVADNVIVGAAQSTTNMPQLSIHQVEININHRALAHFKLQVDGVILHRGNLVWPLDEPDQPASLSLTNIETRLRFLPDDQWALDHFTAGFAGAKLQLTGSLTNASAMRDWKLFHGGGGGGTQPGLLRARLRELARTIDEIHFISPPELSLTVNADARDVRSFNGLLKLDAPGAITPWGTLTNATLFAELTPPIGGNPLPAVKFQLHTDGLKFAIHPSPNQTFAGGTRHFQLDLDAAGDPTMTNVVQAKLNVSVSQLETPWGEAASAHFSTHWTHSITNPIPLAGDSELRLTDARTRWGTVGHIRMIAGLAMPPTNHVSQADASWGLWAGLEPYFLDWHCQVEDVHVGEFESKDIAFGGKWRAPELIITNVHTEIYQGRFDGDAHLDVGTRRADFNCASDFDVLKALPLLPTGARNWFLKQEFAWEKPPVAHGRGSVTLPPWTNSHPDWHGEVLPTFFVSGDFKVGAGSFHKIPASSAYSHIIYSNLTCYLPDLVANRPEGKVDLVMVADDRTQNYYFKFRSTADIKIARHLLETNAQRGLDFFNFSQPPVIEGELWGHWREHERIGFKGNLTVTNFSFRHETANFFRADLDYTNRFIHLYDVRLERTNELLTAPQVTLDIMRKTGFVTNGFSTADPLAIVHCIGPKVTRDMEPYHFTHPPTIHVDGAFPISDDITVADLHFQIEGGPFEWLKFHLPQIKTTVNWQGESMTLSDVQASFYGGTLTGSAGFDFKRKIGTDFHFDTIATGANLQAIMNDWHPGTNSHFEGTLNGHLNITQADSQNPHSWFGKGQMDLHDGLIWDIPLFGILSPVLDYISPGLGKTRASEGTATFVMTNTVLRSEDLEIRSPTIRLFYKGTIDVVDQTADATVSAEVGRDTPLVGPIVGLLSSPFGKLFETRVTGSLTDPKREPVHFPIKVLGTLIHPWRSIKELFPGDNSNSGTNNFAPVPPPPPSPTPH